MVQIDLSRDDLLSDFAVKTIEDRYMVDGETSPQEAFARAAAAFADNEDHAQRLYDYASKHWFMFATPVLSNGGTERGLPISCYLNHVHDSRIGLGEHYVENINLSSTGGGIGGYWGSLRSSGTKTSTGNKTTGVIPFMHVVDAQMLAFNQGATRRGSYAAYIDVSHPEIEEFVNMRKPSGGDIHRKNENLHHAVNLPDAFMVAVKDGKTWDLIDPHTKEVVKTIDARTLWIKILETRVATGEPYLHFIDRSNEAMPESLKALGLQVFGSNLCSEITLPTTPDRTAVCCLSSVNLEKFDEWENDPLFIEDLVRMLDNVLSVFIEKAPPSMWRATTSAKMERSLGLGAMGWHSWLQKNRIPFEGVMAESWNRRIFRNIKEKAVEASRLLARERGEAPDMAGTGMRNAHLMAIAPNASSSILCGQTSPSIEPWSANAFMQKTLTGTGLVKNKWLARDLEELGMNTDEVWTSIVANGGSILHLDGLPDWMYDVYLTAFEIDQAWIVHHAAVRQHWICQAQSVNLFLPPDVEAKTLHKLHFMAWDKGLKTLYYLRSKAARKAEVIANRVERKVRKEYNQMDSECLSCEG